MLYPTAAKKKIAFFGFRMPIYEILSGQTKKFIKIGLELCSSVLLVYTVTLQNTQVLI